MGYSSPCCPRTVPRPSGPIQRCKPPPGCYGRRGKPPWAGRRYLLRRAGPQGSSGWSERTHCALHCLSVAPAVEEKVAARFLPAWGRAVFIPGSTSLETHVTRSPTRLSAQYLISLLLSFRLRLIESFRDGNPSVPIICGPNWVRNDAILGKSRSRHPIPSGQSSSVCTSDAPSPRLLPIRSGFHDT